MITDANTAAVHGYLCSDGYVTTHKPTSKYVYYHVGFRNTCMDLLEDFQRRFYLVFGTQPTITTQKDRCIKMNKKICLGLLNEYESFHSYKWTFPKMETNAAKFWLRAFFDSEGWVTAIQGKDRAVSAESVNVRGLENIRNSLANQFNIRSTIRCRINRNTSILRICGKDNLHEFHAKIGFLHPKKKKKLDDALTSYDAWKWKIPLKKDDRLNFLQKELQHKFKKKKNALRIFSREENLIKLSAFLQYNFGIIGTLGKSINGQGTVYYSLCFYGSYKEKLIEILNHKSTTTCAS